jgi:hypothetical protein
MFKWLSNLFGKKKPVIVEELEPPKVFNTTPLYEEANTGWNHSVGWSYESSMGLKTKEQVIAEYEAEQKGVSVVKTETETILSVPIKKARKPRKKAEPKAKKKKS